MKNTEREIIPTVMPSSYDDFVEKIERVYRYAKTIQVDVMDGRFVPSVSWPYNSRNDEHWKRFVQQLEGLPHWQDCDFEIDLMVIDQVGEAINWIDAGVSRIIGHYEAFFVGRSEEESLKEIDRFLNLKEERGVEVYMALAPNTDNAVLDPILERLDGVQFMGIEKVGFQGQPFAEKVLDKISGLKNKIPQIPIGIDGGVNFDSAPKLIDAGATKLASGSLIFESDDVKGVIDSLKHV